MRTKRNEPRNAGHVVRRQWVRGEGDLRVFVQVPDPLRHSPRQVRACAWARSAVAAKVVVVVVVVVKW